MRSRSFAVRAVAVATVMLGFSLPESQAKLKNCDTIPTGIATSDYWLDFQVPAQLMPDRRFDGRAAQLRVHAVEPVYGNGACRGVQTLAAVLVHGRTIPGSASFDLRNPTPGDPTGERISLQASMARAGIRTFAPDLIGYGRSTRFADGLDDPCNASMPTDRTRNAGVFPLDQQGRYLGDGLTPPADGLGVNPLAGARCPHASSIYFSNPDVFARDIMQVIDDVIARVRPRGNKVMLVGNSFGGPSIARTLFLMGDDADRKVNRVVFLSSLFNRLPGLIDEVNLPTEEDELSELERSTSFPLTLSRLGGWSGIGSPPRDAFCSGRVIPGAPTALKDQLLALDPLGAGWGGSDPANPTGLLRSPTFSLYGWNRDVAATFTIPTLILHGADDQTSPVRNSDNMFDALTSVEQKVLVQVQCASHQMQQEGCSGARCKDADPVTVPYGGLTETWEGPHRTIAAALTEWAKHGSFDGSACGRFDVDSSGIARPVGAQACPSA